MSEALQYTGGCLCGAIRFRAQPEKPEVAACHCSMCQKWSGGPLFALDCGANFQIENKQHLGIYKSSEWAERGFCKKCGSSVFWRLLHQDSNYIPAAAFDNLNDVSFTHEIFIDNKPGYYDFANETHKMTEAEVIAHFSAQATSG